MRKTNVAIVGLGFHGELLLRRLVGCDNIGINIACAVEPEDGQGRRQANVYGIALVGLEDLICFGSDIDVIFDLRSDIGSQARLRRAITARGNYHTQVFSEKAVELANVLLADAPDRMAV